MKRSEEQFLMDVAKLSGARSKAIRLKVGAVVTDREGNFVATGYNGGIRGLENEQLEKRVYQCDETNPLQDSCYPYDDSLGNYRLVTDENIVIHAEQNVLMHAARRGISIDGGSVFVTHSPCSKCTGLMIQAGIKEVIYNETYRLHDEVEDQYGHYIKFRKIGACI